MIDEPYPPGQLFVHPVGKGQDVALPQGPAPREGNVDLAAHGHGKIVPVPVGEGGVRTVGPVVDDHVGVLHGPAFLQQEDVVFFADLDHALGPDGGLDLADVGLTQKVHAEPALADASADGAGQLAV